MKTGRKTNLHRNTDSLINSFKHLLSYYVPGPVVGFGQNRHSLASPHLCSLWPNLVRSLNSISIKLCPCSSTSPATDHQSNHHPTSQTTYGVLKKIHKTKNLTIKIEIINRSKTCHKVDKTYIILSIYLIWMLDMKKGPNTQMLDWLSQDDISSWE